MRDVLAPAIRYAGEGFPVTQTIAYTKGLDFRPGPRKPTADIVHWDHW